MKPTIFVVEDEVDISRLIRLHLEQVGYSVREFPSTTGVLFEAEAVRPALFLLDVMVPGGDGFDLCRCIRQSAQIGGTAVIFLTAKTRELDRVLGLDLGADDYITKPFSPREMVARVRAVLRRFDPPDVPAIVKMGDLEIDSGAMTIWVRAQRISTTTTEFRLLEWLMSHPGRVFTRDELLNKVWRDTSYVTPRSVDVYVRRLREKIEDNPEAPRYIRTVRGAGYRFEVPRSDSQTSI